MKKRIEHIQLASTSTARRNLLRQYKIPHHSFAPGILEETISGHTAKILAEKRAAAKALSISQLHQDSLIIGCDQTAEIDGNLITKARNVEEAAAIMKRLNGKEHTLHSAFAIACGKNVLVQDLISTTMSMRELSTDEQFSYLSTNEWEGCVGGYRIEEQGIHLFEEVGEHTAIMGLPIIQLLQQLRNLGINLLTDPEGPWDINTEDYL